MTRKQLIILGSLADLVLLVFCLFGLLAGLEVMGAEEAVDVPTPSPTVVPTPIAMELVTATAPTPASLPTPPPAGNGPPVISCHEVRQITWWFGEVLSCTVQGDHLSVVANYSPIVVDRYGETSEGISLQRKLDSLALRESALRAVYTYLGAFPELASLDLTIYYWRAPALTLPHVDRERAEQAARASGGLGIADLVDRYGPKDEEIFERLIHSPGDDTCYERGGEATLEALGVFWGDAILVGPDACITPEEQAVLHGYR